MPEDRYFKTPALAFSITENLEFTGDILLAFIFDLSGSPVAVRKYWLSTKVQPFIKNSRYSFTVCLHHAGALFGR